MHRRIAISDTSTVKALNQNDSFTPRTRMVVRMTTAARAIGSMIIAAALLSQACTQNCKEPEGWPAGGAARAAYGFNLQDV
jgi:hypothetical protein